MWALQMESCDAEVSTDASDLGWGIYFQMVLHRGLWTSIADAPAHINAKELMTLLIFLRDFLLLSDAPLSLLWRTDSSTAMAYVRKEGDTVSRPLLLAREIFLLAHERSVRIPRVFFVGEESACQRSISLCLSWTGISQKRLFAVLFVIGVSL